MGDTPTRDHRVRVERTAPQSFVARCSCGWEGLNRKGTPFWNKAGPLSAVLGHLQEHGLEMTDLPEYHDLDPGSRRGHAG